MDGRIWMPTGAGTTFPGRVRCGSLTVAADPGFDPYGYGSWVWSPGAGYVWASGYGWGWTPYRCGNWSYWGGFGWGWMPGVNCGFGGWGFGGPVYVINIIRPPLGYRPHPLPVHGPGGSPSDCAGASGAHMPSVPVQVAQGPRTIAGHTVEPLRPIGNAYTSRGGSVVGASLMRDFPVDRVNHQPVMGNTLGCGSRVRRRPGREWRSGAYRSNAGTARRLRYPVSLRRPMAPACAVDTCFAGRSSTIAAPRTFESAPAFDGTSAASTAGVCASAASGVIRHAPLRDRPMTPAPHPAPSAPAAAPRSR